MTFNRMIAIGSVLLVVTIAWLVFELYLDWKWHASHKPAASDSHERLPPRLD